jgi:hypothetical protein
LEQLNNLTRDFEQAQGTIKQLETVKLNLENEKQKDQKLLEKWKSFVEEKTQR